MNVAQKRGVVIDLETLLRPFEVTFFDESLAGSVTTANVGHIPKIPNPLPGAEQSGPESFWKHQTKNTDEPRGSRLVHIPVLQDENTKDVKKTTYSK